MYFYDETYPRFTLRLIVIIVFLIHCISSWRICLYHCQLFCVSSKILYFFILINLFVISINSIKALFAFALIMRSSPPCLLRIPMFHQFAVLLILSLSIWHCLSSALQFLRAFIFLAICALCVSCAAVLTFQKLMNVGC